jgi:hypothetical protein
MFSAHALPSFTSHNPKATPSATIGHSPPESPLNLRPTIPSPLALRASTCPNRKLVQNRWKPSALRGGLPDSFGLFASPCARLLHLLADEERATCVMSECGRHRGVLELPKHASSAISLAERSAMCRDSRAVRKSLIKLRKAFWKLVDVLSVARASVAKIGDERLSAFASFHRRNALNGPCMSSTCPHAGSLLCLTEV